MANTGSVAVQMKELLDEVNKDVQASVKKNMDAVAKESVQKLKNTSPRKTGSYAKGWAVKKQGEMDAIVHNRTDYQLTHLLEKPHATGRYKGGKYPKKVDYTGTIAKIEAEYTNKFYEEVLAKI